MTTLTHDKGFKATEKPSHTQAETSKEMVTLQQNHNINSLNGNENVCAKSFSQKREVRILITWALVMYNK